MFFWYTATNEAWSEGLALHEPTIRYRQNRTREACPEQSRRDNSDAHLTRQVMSLELVVAPANGCLDCGPWEQTFYWEVDGRRGKRVLVKTSRA